MLRISVIIALELAIVALVAMRLIGGGGSDRATLGQLRLSADGNLVTASAAVEDGTPAIRELVVDWGDGTADPITIEGRARAFTVSAEHLYSDERSFVVRLIARYTDGSEQVRRQALAVEGAPPSSVTSTNPSSGAGSTPTPAPPPAATSAATPEATAEATPEPTAEATPEPTPQPTAVRPRPTPAATPQPTPEPTPEPTSEPVLEPTPQQGNLPPQITILSIDPAAEEFSVSLVVLVVDPEGQVAGVGIDWGDGAFDEATPSIGPIVVNHTYGAAGIYPVTVFALDILGGESTAFVPATAR